MNRETTDKVKVYLEELKRCYWKLQGVAEKLQEAEVRATSTNSARTSDTYTGGGVSDRTASAVITLDKLRTAYIKAADEYMQVKFKYTQQLHRVEDLDYINILYGRYFAFKTLKEVSKDLNLEYRWLCRKHGYALEAFYRSNAEEIEKRFST